MSMSRSGSTYVTEESKSDSRAVEKIKVAALTSGRDVPSSRFRIRQYRDVLAAHGVEVAEYCPPVSQMIQLPGRLGEMRRRHLLPWLAIQTAVNVFSRIPALIGARNADVAWINRSIIPGLDESVFLLPRPRVLDVDDAIWLTDPRGKRAAAHLAARVDGVVAGNEYLASWYREYNDNVFVVPTAVDTAKYCPAQETTRSHVPRVTIGWIGTDGNFPNLELVKPTIYRILEERRDIRVLIVANRSPRGWRFDQERLVFHTWTAEREVKDLQDMDIGIMPLYDNEWTRGKCSFKMLQYLAVGIPVVVSPVGMNRTVLGGADIGFAASTEEEWMSSLLALCDDPKLRIWKGHNARALVERIYSKDSVAAKLAAILRDIA